MEQIYTAIQAAATQDAHGFREAINAALADKIQDALEMKKLEVASGMFNSQEEASAQETESNEDVQATA
jgi:hypothetical protein